MFNQPRLAFLLVVVVPLLHGHSAGAYLKGISGYSGKQGTICNACHSGGIAPSVAFTGPSTLDPGNTANFMFTVQSGAPDVQQASGFNVAASGGTLRTVAAQKEQVLDGELTHTQPKVNDDSGSASWAFKWKAPAAAGNYVLYGAGNSVNQSNTPEGDRAASTVFFIAVGNVTPLPTWTPTFTVGSPPSPTPSPIAAPSSPTPTATSIPSSTPTLTPTSTPTPTSSQAMVPTDTPGFTETPSFVGTPMPTDTPIDQATSTATDTATPTSTPMPTATTTVTPSMPPTLVAEPGDSNCDGLITAADLPQLLALLPLNDAGPCGAADANGDGTVDEADVTFTIAALFGAQS